MTTSTVTFNLYDMTGGPEDGRFSITISEDSHYLLSIRPTEDGVGEGVQLHVDLVQPHEYDEDVVEHLLETLAGEVRQRIVTGEKLPFDHPMGGGVLKIGGAIKYEDRMWEAVSHIINLFKTQVIELPPPSELHKIEPCTACGAPRFLKLRKDAAGAWLKPVLACPDWRRHPREDE